MNLQQDVKLQSISDLQGPQVVVFRKIDGMPDTIFQCLPDHDIEDPVSYWYVKNKIEIHFPTKYKDIMDYLNGFRDIIVDFENNQAWVKPYGTTQEGIDEFRKKLYSLETLREDARKEAEKEHQLSAYLYNSEPPTMGPQG